MEEGTIEKTVPAGQPSPDVGGSLTRRRRLHWILAGIGVVFVAVVAAAAVLAATYQPVSDGMATPAINGPVTVRAVNNFALMRGQLYIPPQPASSGTLTVSLENSGPLAVTIESVVFDDPIWPPVLAPAGPATYEPLTDTPQPLTASSPRIAGLVLRPGENVEIRLPFRTPSCWLSGRAEVSDVLVTTKYLFWTHHFTVSFTDSADPSQGMILAHLPIQPGTQNANCPSGR